MFYRTSESLYLYFKTGEHSSYVVLIPAIFAIVLSIAFHQIKQEYFKQ